MKLRFYNGALRLRLSQSEVARMAEQGRVEDVITFASGQKLEYAIESGAVPEVSASFEHNRVCVRVPSEAAKSWIESDRIGIETSKILIEKDFQCIHPASEGDTDGFPNPLAIPHS